MDIPLPAPKDNILAFWDRITPGYFGVINNPTLRGRGISEQDTETSRHVAVINPGVCAEIFQE